MSTASTRDKIIFVTPPCHSGVVDVLGRWIPLNFVYLAGVARQAGFAAEIYDARTKNHTLSDIEQYLRTSGASYIAVSAITSTIAVSIKILELAKRINPDILTIMGGIHPSFCWEEVLTTTAAADVIICGEGEATLKELLPALEIGGDLSTVPGVAFRRDGTVIKTPGRPLIEAIDQLPVAWDLLDWADYTFFVMPDARLGAISTSRGCEPDTAGCSRHNVPEHHRRLRDCRSVVGEIAHLYETCGVTVFMIADERPTRECERWELLLDLLIERGLPVFLLLETRAADIIRDRDILWKYRKAGVVHMYLPVEPDDQAAAEHCRERGAVADIKLALDSIHEQGIVSEVSFVVGVPEETRESIEQTLRTAQYLNPDNVQFIPLTPWPYADRYDSVRPYIRVHDYSKYNFIDPVVQPRRMTMLQVDVAIMDCYRKFYMGKFPEIMVMKDLFKRDYLMKAMKLIIGSAFILRKMGMGMLGKVPVKIEEMMSRMNRKA